MEEIKESNVAVLMVHGIGDHVPGDMLMGVVNGFYNLFVGSFKSKKGLVNIKTDLRELKDGKALGSYTLPGNEKNYSRVREYKKYSFYVDISGEQIRKKINFTCLYPISLKPLVSASGSYH